MFIFSFSITAYEDCNNHNECKIRIKCVLPRIAECDDFRCRCNVPKNPLSARPERVHISPTRKNDYWH